LGKIVNRSLNNRIGFFKFGFQFTTLPTGKFRIPGKKVLIKDSGYPKIVVMDVTETTIERPKKNRKNVTQERKKITRSKFS